MAPHQVEHGITEMITGVDLVAWQFELQVERCCYALPSWLHGLHPMPLKPAPACTVASKSSSAVFLFLVSQGAQGDDLPADLATYKPSINGSAIEVGVPIK